MTESNLGSIKFPEKPEVQSLLRIFQDTFEALSHDEDYQQGMRMAVPGVGEMYGVRVPLLRDFARRLLQTYKGQHQALERLARASWEAGTREHRLVALYLLEKVKLSPQARWELALEFMPHIDNWETCDVMCMSLQGIAICQEPGYMEAVEKWATDQNFWIRRAALVTTTRLRNAKIPDDVRQDLDRRTLALCRALLYDEEKYIRKAVDWTVREVLRRNYPLARAWMMERAKEGLQQPALSTLKLAAKKLEEGDQKTFLREIESTK